MVAHLVKNLPAVQETCILSLGQADPLEKEMATHSSTLAWKIVWTDEPIVSGVAEVEHDLVTKPPLEHGHTDHWTGKDPSWCRYLEN